MFDSELTRLKNMTLNLFRNLAIGGIILPHSFLFRTVSSKELLLVLDLRLVRSPARSRRSRTGGEHARECAGAGLHAGAVLQPVVCTRHEEAVVQPALPAFAESLLPEPVRDADIRK